MSTKVVKNLSNEKQNALNCQMEILKCWCCESPLCLLYDFPFQFTNWIWSNKCKDLKEEIS